MEHMRGTNLLFRRSGRTLEEAVQWIALNDNEGDNDSVDMLEGYLTVALVADLWHIHRRTVARLVYRARRDKRGK